MQIPYNKLATLLGIEPRISGFADPIIDQLDFFASSSQANGSISLVHKPLISLQNVGVGLFKDPSLMGTFSLPSLSNMAKVAKVDTCNMIFSTSSDLRKITNSSKVDSSNESMPLSPIELHSNQYFWLARRTQIHLRQLYG